MINKIKSFFKKSKNNKIFYATLVFNEPYKDYFQIKVYSSNKDNIKLIFDGETGNLKSAKVLK